MADIESLVKKFLAAQNADSVDAIVNCYAPNGARVYGHGETRGRENLRSLYQSVTGALTKRKMTVRHLTVAGRTAVLEYTEQATHSAVVKAQHGEIPPSHAEIEIHGIAVLQYEGDEIAEARIYSDALYQLLARSKGR
jgi:ketosteroid isomerase-like protein